MGAASQPAVQISGQSGLRVQIPNFQLQIQTQINLRIQAQLRLTLCVVALALWAL